MRDNLFFPRMATAGSAVMDAATSGGGGESTESGGGGDNEIVVSSPPPPKDHSNEIAELKRKHEQLTQMIQNFKPAQPAAPASPVAPPVSPEQMEQNFWKNPVGSSAAIATWVAQQNLKQLQEGQIPIIDSMVSMVRKEMVREHKELFDAYGSEIESIVNNVELQYRTNPNIWQHAIDTVRGKHFEELAGKRQVKNNSSAAPGLPGTATGQQRAPQLSPEESLIADIYKLSPAEYLEGKKMITDPVAQAAAWDNVLTRDSDVAKRRKANANTK